jgi:tripartite ATP-independent transporter DctM subunit
MGSPISFFDKVLQSIARAMNALGAGVVLIMVLLMTVNVIFRYLLASPFRGAVELEEFFQVGVVFFGLAYTAIKKGHVRVDFIVARLSPRIQEVINAVGLLISVGLTVLMAWRTAIWAYTNWSQQNTSILLRIPVHWFVCLAAIGLLLFFLVLLMEFCRSFLRVMEEGLASLGAFFLALIVILALSWLVWVLQPSANTVTTIGFAVLLALIFLGVYIAFAMMVVGFVGMIYLAGLNAGFHLLSTVPYTVASEYNLSVVPFFVLMGHLCAVAGISQDLYKTAYIWLGQLRGGLAIGTIGGCAGFAAVSGDSMGTAAVMGAAALPEMKKYHYKPSLATGCVAAGGTLGILIPPSIAFIIYGIITDQSIAKLFMAGILPGILLAALFALAVVIQAFFDPEVAPPGPSTTWKEKIGSLRNTWSTILIFALVIGGIYVGVFTPTEAGAIGASGALTIGLINRQLTWSKLIDALLATGRTVSMLFLLLFGAMILGYFMAASEAPLKISEAISNLPLSKYLLLTAVLLVYVFLGCVMNILPAVIITLPIFFPAINGLGFDPIWFGVVLVIIMEMGMISPPVGMNVFVIQGIAKDVPLADIYRGVLPFVLAMVVSVIILTIFPQIALILPNTMGK